ncbi:hypothetical protein QZH41_017965, partial [Actinostola sp. cb2023]
MGVCAGVQASLLVECGVPVKINHMVPYIPLVRLGEDIGASKSHGVVLISILAGGSFLGRTVCGSIADITCCSRLRLCQMALLCIAVRTTLVAFAPSFIWLAVMRLYLVSA